MSELTLLFSKPLVINKLDLSNEQYSLIENVFNETLFSQTKLNDNDEKANDISLNLKILDNANLKFLKKTILDLFLYFNKQILKYNAKFQITTSWFTYSKQGKYGSYHNHSNSMFSGVFYFTENASSIKFTNFNRGTSFGLVPTEHNVFNSTSWNVKPEKGTLLFFPSEVHHYVNVSYNKRKSLAFNIVPIGEYGTNDSKVNITYE